MSDVKRALWVMICGSVLFLSAALVFSVGRDFWEADGDAARIAVVDDDRVQFGAYFAVLGTGTIILAIGLWMFGRAVAAIEEPGRRRTAATTAGWLGLVGAIAGVMRLALGLFGTPELIVESPLDIVVGAIAAIATTIALITIGVLAWSAPPPKWASVVLVLAAVTGAITFPDVAVLGVIVFSIANLVVMRRAVPARVPAAPARP